MFGCCLILFFCHLFALLLAFGLVVGIELSRILLPRYRRKRYPFAPSAIAIVAAGAPLALLLFAPLLGKTHPAFTDILPQLTFASLMLRLKELLWFSRAYNPTVDLISLAVVLGLGAYGLTRGLLRFDIPALLPIGGLIVTYLIVPDGWFGTHYLPDRLPQVIFFLGVAATDVVVKKSWERTSLFLIVAVLAVTRGAVAQQAWRSANARFAPVIAAFSNIPEGSRIYTAIAHKGDSSLNRRLPYSQLAGYATIYRHAFCLDTYADPSQNVVLRQPVYETAPRTPRNYQADGPQDPDDPYDPARLAFYDFALVIGPTLWPQTPPQSLKPVVAEPDYTLFRIEHPDRR